MRDIESELERVHRKARDATKYLWFLRSLKYHCAWYHCPCQITLQFMCLYVYLSFQGQHWKNARGLLLARHLGGLHERSPQQRTGKARIQNEATFPLKLYSKGTVHG